VADQQRQSEVAGDGVGVDTDAEHPQAISQIMLPDRRAELRVPAAVEDVIDQNIQPAVIMIDPLNQPPDLLRLQVVDAQRNPAAGSCDQLTRLLDRLRAADL
jgi:hypothetical protein